MALAPMRSCVAPGAPNPSCGGGRSGSCERRPRPAARQDPPAGPQATQPVDHRAVIALTAEDPPEETTHWTAGLMARTVGISVSAVQRIWQAHGLRPHRVRRFKLSKDPEFVPKTAQNRRPLRQPAGPRHCALGRREVADTGARSHPARVADEEGSRWYLDARLVWGVSRQSLNF